MTNNRMEKSLQKIRDTSSVFYYCFGISWNSSPLYTIIRLLAQILIPVISMLCAFLGKYIIDLLSDYHNITNAEKALISALSIGLIFKVLSLVTNNLREYTSSLHNDILTNYMNINMINKSLNVDLSFFDSSKFYDFFESVKRDNRAFISYIWNVMDFISYMFSLICILIIVCSTNLLIAVVIILVTIPTSVVNQKYTKSIYMFDLSKIKEERKMYYIYYVLTDKLFVQDIRLYNTGKMLEQRYKNIWSTIFKDRRNLVKKRAIISMILSVFPEIFCFVYLIFITIGIINGNNTLGDYSLYSGLLIQLINSINAFIRAAVMIYEDNLKIENIKLFEKMSVSEIKSGNKILTGSVNIEFKNVCFGYKNSDKPILNNVSFILKPGEKMGIVGTNGSGKTTLIKLLLRFYDVSSGEILLNGINISDYELNSLRMNFSLFLQESIIYGFSLKDNVIISDYSEYRCNDEEIISALRKSESLDIINNAPNGLETFLTKMFDDKGIELSGGQKQKIALARTFFRKKNVIILDEPSAALDPEAEHRIFSSVHELNKNTSAIFITHRLQNMSLLDNIIVLESGNIIEQGNHLELMRSKGRYYELYKYQADKYESTV